MKKLLIAAAIVCAAAMSQAASFNWLSTAAQKAPDIDLTNLKVGEVGVTSGNLANMTAVTWAYEMFLDNGTDTDTLTGTPAFKLGKYNMSGLSSDVVKNAAAGAPDVKVDYSIIITGTYTDTKGDVWTITSDAITGSESFGEIATLQLNTGVATKFTVSTSAVPEPTSGLLLLLGVAGMALRRRRA